MVQHVNQFPNDQECQRFCTTIQDPVSFLHTDIEDHEFIV